MTTSNSVVLANLIQTNPGDYSLAVRWTIGTGGADEEVRLPGLNDKFVITIRSRTDRYLQADGTFGAAGSSYQFESSPMKFAMIDPPREKRPVADHEELFQRFAVAPRAPVLPSDVEEVDRGSNEIVKRLMDGKGLGVLHLLKNVDPEENARFATDIVSRKLEQLVRDLPKDEHGFEDLSSNQKLRLLAASQLAKYLISTELKPKESLSAFAELHRSLVTMVSDLRVHTLSVEEFTDQLADRAPLSASLGLKNFRSIAEIYEFSAMLMDVVSNPGTLRALEETTYSPSQVRKQLNIKAFQGGSMIDFWSDPFNEGGIGAEIDRGKLHSSSELLGLGKNIHGILQSTIDDLREDTDNNFLYVQLSDANGTYGTCTAILTPNDIENAVNNGASFSPQPPKQANVNFDLTQSDSVFPPEKRKFSATEPGFATGNGKVEIHIHPHDPDQKPRDCDGRVIDDAPAVALESGFNIYGIWETAPGMQTYFDDPSLIPSLDMLRPFLITRRYSYSRDLLGSFPDLDGSMHPSLSRILKEPPWHAIVPRPKRILDYGDHEDTGAETQADPDEVPDLLYREPQTEAPTIYSFDIRRGLDVRSERPPIDFTPWDPGALVDESWSMQADRSGVTTNETPERYRFFVTSVDCFDQESNPVSVLGADVESVETSGAERWIFSPTFRTPIGAPDNLVVSYHPIGVDQPSPKISVTWDWPDLTQDKGIAKLISQLNADGFRLSARLRLYRRRLTKPIDPSSLEELRLLRTADDLNWEHFEIDMALRGWREAFDYVVDAPRDGMPWEFEEVLSYKDLGFEYLVAVNFQLPDEAHKYWCVPTRNRTLAYVERAEDDSLTAKTAIITESSTTSSIVQHSPVMAPNLDSPRGAVSNQVTGSRLIAKPVRPLPGIQRDNILAKLITAKIPEIENLDAVIENDENNWRGTGIELTAFQAASADSALIRSLSGSSYDLNSQQLAAARMILAKSFQQVSKDMASSFSKPTVAQNPTIGFRGLLKLEWMYEAHISAPPVENGSDAEATSFEIHQIRAALDAGHAAKSANLNASAQVSGDGYELLFDVPDEADADERKAFKEALEALGSQAIPKACVFEQQNGAVYTAIIEEVTFPEEEFPDSARVKANSLGQSLGTGSGRIAIFFAVSVASKDAEGLDEQEAVKQNIVLPVGGGARELGCWWVVPRSAQDVRGNSENWALFTAELEPTIEPRTISDFTAYSALDREVESLDPQNHADWLPNDIQDELDADSNPHLVIRWNKPDSDDLSLVVERQKKRVAPPSDNELARSLLVRSQWDIIREIEEGADTPELSLSDLSLLTNEESGWLLGFSINTQGELVEESSTLVRANQALSAVNGLPNLHGNLSGMPTFMDYWHTIGDADAAMDGNFIYRYRLRVARLLPAGDPNNEADYLHSPPTTWSEWVLPESPPILVRKLAPVETIRDDLLSPQVDIVFRSDPRLKSNLRESHSALLRQFDRTQGRTEQADLDWKYRVVVQRRLLVVSPGETGSLQTEILRDVGGPRELISEGEAIVVDTQIEREFADDTLQIEYEIYVQQFALRLKNGTTIEVPVRSHSSEPLERVVLDVPPPPSSDQEYHVLQVVKVR